MRRNIAGILFTGRYPGSVHQDGEYAGREISISQVGKIWHAGTIYIDRPDIMVKAGTQHEAVSRLKAALDWTPATKDGTK